MKWKENKPFLLVAFGVCLYALLMNLKVVFAALDSVIGLLMPLLTGLLIAFVLNVPMTGIEKRLANKISAKKLVAPLSLILTLLGLAFVIFLAITLLFPTLAQSIRSIQPLLKEKIPEWTALLKANGIDTAQVESWLSQLDFKQTNGMVGTIVQGAKSTVSVLSNMLFGLVIAIYILATKKSLGPQVKQAIYAYLDKEHADRLYEVGNLVRTTYAKFLSGQCVEAIILGTLICVVYGVLRIPYAALIGFLTGLFAFVPYVGAFASCAIGAVLIALSEPDKVLIAIISYLIVQFVENQFIYPRVVGSSVGLTPLVTLIAALVGGKLFGLLGIVFFIPLVAVLSVLFDQDVKRREKAKEKHSTT